MFAELICRIRKVTHLSYLSPFERRLNRALWALAWIALLFGFAQHVLLIKVPEVFRGGAQIGDLLYDLSIAYVGAFVFYLLVIRMPLRRDRRNIYGIVGPLMTSAVGIAWELMQTLHKAAGFHGVRQNTLANVTETCRSITPTSQTHYLRSSDVTAYFTVAEKMSRFVADIGRVNQRILELSGYVSTDVIRLIMTIDQGDGIFAIFGSRVRPEFYSPGRNLEHIASSIFDYLLVIDRLDSLRREFYPIAEAPLPFLLAETNHQSSESPLAGFEAWMDSEIAKYVQGEQATRESQD